MRKEDAKEGLRVVDSEGFGTLHENIGHKDVSEWYVKWDDGEECAVLDFDYLETTGKIQVLLAPPQMRTDKIEHAKALITELYNTQDGGVGGYGHIVFDDDNIENGNILWCLKSAYKKEYKDDLSEECRQASIKALEYFLELTEEEREICLGIEDI